MCHYAQFILTFVVLFPIFLLTQYLSPINTASHTPPQDDHWRIICEWGKLGQQCCHAAMKLLGEKGSCVAQTILWVYRKIDYLKLLILLPPLWSAGIIGVCYWVSYGYWFWLLVLIAVNCCVLVAFGNWATGVPNDKGTDATVQSWGSKLSLLNVKETKALRILLNLAVQKQGWSLGESQFSHQRW